MIVGWAVLRPVLPDAFDMLIAAVLDDGGLFPAAPRITCDELMGSGLQAMAAGQDGHRGKAHVFLCGLECPDAEQTLIAIEFLLELGFHDDPHILPELVRLLLGIGERLAEQSRREQRRIRRLPSLRVLISRDEDREATSPLPKKGNKGQIEMIALPRE